MPKISALEYEKRIFAIQGWIIEGVQSALIVRQIISSGWTDAKKEKDKIRSAERMLSAARDKWTNIEEAKIEQKRKLRVDEMKQYKRKLQAKYQGTPAGIFACVAVDKEINKLENLYPASKVEVTGKNGAPIETTNFNVSLSKEDIEKLSAILEDKV